MNYHIYFKENWNTWTGPMLPILYHLDTDTDTYQQVLQIIINVENWVSSLPTRTLACTSETFPFLLSQEKTVWVSKWLAEAEPGLWARPLHVVTELGKSWSWPVQRLDQEGLDQGRPLDCSQAGHAALQSTAGRRLLEECSPWCRILTILVTPGSGTTSA